MTPRSTDAVVFDCDGVLADTVSCWNAAFLSVGTAFGAPLTTEQLAQLSGASVSGASELIVRWAGLRTPTRIVADALYEHLLTAIDDADLAPFSGVRELLDTLVHKVSLAVASNSPRAVLHSVLARLQLSQYFTVLVSADDVDSPKPAPDPYLAACAGLGADPLKSFALEDSVTGITSAATARLAVIEVTGPEPARDGEHSPLAALRVASLADPRLAPFILDGRSMMTMNRRLSNGELPD